MLDNSMKDVPKVFSFTDLVSESGMVFFIRLRNVSIVG
jgi:hypothetical protein